MQTIIQVACKAGESLREAIKNDTCREDYGLKVNRVTKAGQEWMKITSTAENRRGALNIEWDRNTSVLLCRVVNRAGGKPDQVVGDFVAYLLERHRRRIRHMTIWVQ